MLSGVFFSILVAFGFRALRLTAKIAVTLFLGIIFYMFFNEVIGYSGDSLYYSPARGEAISIGDGATMVAGLYIIGALITPDTSRFCRSGKDVFWMIITAVILGEFCITGIAILVAHALGTSNVVEIMIHTAGWVGALTVVLAAIKVNDGNLYSASINMSGFIQMITGKKHSYPLITLAIGSIGTLLAISGILEHFVSFLIALGVIFTPIAGVILVDYYILRTSRVHLDISRTKASLPDDSTTPRTGWLAIASCAAGSLAGLTFGYGIPSLNSLLVAGMVYYLMVKVYNVLKINQKL